VNVEVPGDRHRARPSRPLPLLVFLHGALRDRRACAGSEARSVPHTGWKPGERPGLRSRRSGSRRGLHRSRSSTLDWTPPAERTTLGVFGRAGERTTAVIGSENERESSPPFARQTTAEPAPSPLLTASGTNSQTGRREEPLVLVAADDPLAPGVPRGATRRRQLGGPARGMAGSDSQGGREPAPPRRSLISQGAG
jgi:hypothetical protein